jgi:dTDP-N-acetylfucosamine:lipid II N-acetylfucosaminyltransferase
MLYRMKVQLTASRFKHEAYGKVDRILTWMNGEFSFAKAKLPVSKAAHEFFFYENPTSFQELTAMAGRREVNDLPVYILGNSGSRTNNHLDALDFLQQHAVKAKLILPVSYGDAKYVSLLKKRASLYTLGPVEFLDRFMSFDEYLTFLRSTDGLIMNTLRPQGYGNIFMMMCLGKPVYMNTRNVSLSDLERNNIPYHTFQDITKSQVHANTSAKAIEHLFAQEKLAGTYRQLFS